MKKIIGNFLIVLSVLLVALVAVPWNDISQWGITLPILTTYEMYIKGGIGAFTILVGIAYLVMANIEYRNYGYVNRNTARTAFLPIYMFTISIMIYGASINYFIYGVAGGSTNLLILGFFGLVALTLIVFGHFFGDTFKNESNGRRIAHFVLLVELAGIAGYLVYWFFTWKLSNYDYAAFNSYYFILAVAVGILLYIVHIVLSLVNSKKNQEIEDLEDEIEDLVDTKINPQKNPETKKSEKSRKQERQERQEIVKAHDGKKTMIVSNQQTIVSSESNIDPTNMIYEDVVVDPEFTKTTSPTNQPNSIEYYIEKPKMFKPLDPTFDQLVAYVRELPHVVTKLDDDRITFYVDRKPFLVLMNFGNYYRMAFKYDLEKGIRLIIKYPTISKNKSTRREWETGLF